MAKEGKAHARKRKETIDLTAREARKVSGGKAGKDKPDYLIVKLNDNLVTGVSPTENRS
jgi:hypothetical protein